MSQSASESISGQVNFGNVASDTKSWLVPAIIMGALVILAAMVALGLLTERIVLRPLVNQPQITLFMATIGLTFVIEGLGAQGLPEPRYVD